MTEPKSDKLASWTPFLNALSGLTSKLIWVVIGVIVLGAVGRYLYIQAPAPNEVAKAIPREASIRDPIPWQDVDAAVVVALRTSHSEAETFADDKLLAWTGQLQTLIDEQFLDWYFSYWQQQWLGLKALGYWIADSGITEKIIGEQPTMAERITEELQDEFSKRILRPQIAQLHLERMTQETVDHYVQSVQHHSAAIPATYRIPRAAWERYLDDIAVLTSTIEGNREQPLTLKTLVASGAAGGALAVGKLTQTLKPLIAKIGTKMTTKAAAKGAGRAVAKMASKTGAKVGAKVGGKFLGAIVGVGVIIWDVWDHYQTKEVERPILRKNLADYLVELRHSLLHEPNAGIMTIIEELESSMIASLKHLNEAQR